MLDINLLGPGIENRNLLIMYNKSIYNIKRKNCTLSIKIKTDAVSK